MRKRARREIGTILGVGVILLGMVFATSQLSRSNRKEQFITWRQTIEEARAHQGMEIVEWSVVQNTIGTLRSGPTFDEKLIPYDGTVVNLIGFTVPLYEFRAVSEFILLPMPLECYFCQSPPMRDVVLVHMAQGKTADIVNEPVLVSGTLVLNDEPGTKFFYTIEDGMMGAGEATGKLSPKDIAPEHRIPKHMREDPELLDAVKPRAAPEEAGPGT